MKPHGRSGPQTGFLACADITGYTGFLTGSELAHAHEILRGLLQQVTSALSHPLEVVKYEGDAVLCRAPDAAVGDVAMLLDVLEQAYVRFSDHLFNMKVCTTCTCAACGNVQQLDLKLVLHYGEYIADDAGPHRDVSGPDVILLHRLMKNEVTAATGVRAYLLATAAALDRLGRPDGFVAHEEEVEAFGRVQCCVLDLSTVLARSRETRAVRVTEDAAEVRCECVIPAAPAAVWDWFFDPARRLQWDRTMKGFENRRRRAGRADVGDTMHCAHGSFTVIGTTLDWKPFRYFTQEFRRDDGGFLPPPLMMTLETHNLDDGSTRAVQLFRVIGGGILQRAAMRILRGMIEKQGNADLARLSAAVAAESAGRVH